MDVVKIGAYLAELRKQHGFSQEELGKKIGVSNKTVSRWETGKYLAPVDALESLSNLYGITINEILSGKALSDCEYKKAAEENIKSVLSVSAFTLQEKIRFFQKKWKKEHAFATTLEMLAILTVILAGIILDNGLLLIGIILGFGWGIYKYNRMMQFVETYAFDGEKKEP